MKFEKGGGSQNEKPTCVTCGKRHYEKCLSSTSGYYGCGKYDHKVRDRPTIAARGREGKEVSPSAPKEDSVGKPFLKIFINDSLNLRVFKDDYHTSIRRKPTNFDEEIRPNHPSQFSLTHSSYGDFERVLF